MVIFDNEYLKQYLEQHASLQVYANREWYTITELSDVDSPQYGIGINAQGKAATFRYPEISVVRADGFEMTIDQLQNKAAGKPDDTGEEGGDTGGDKGGDGSEFELGGGEPGGGEPGGGEPGGDEPKPEEEPPQESYRRIVANMIMEAKKKEKDAPFQDGDFVENIDTTDEYCGSRGVVTDVIKGDTDNDCEVKYRIYNYGYNFKPGQSISVDGRSLKKIERGDESKPRR